MTILLIKEGVDCPDIFCSWDLGFRRCQHLHQSDLFRGKWTPIRNHDYVEGSFPMQQLTLAFILESVRVYDVQALC